MSDSDRFPEILADLFEGSETRFSKELVKKLRTLYEEGISEGRSQEKAEGLLNFEITGKNSTTNSWATASPEQILGELKRVAKVQKSQPVLPGALDLHFAIDPPDLNNPWADLNNPWRPYRAEFYGNWIPLDRSLLDDE